ncbi:MAG: DbpA RNA binding domain-containing protein, partial [Bacteroidetes bacterium]|nr:DbpA RNA binding domain-containing protein [Bacteroidota bacterium]
LCINVGSKKKLNASRLMGLINEGLNSSDAEIGKIEIMKKFSFFEIEETVTDKLIKALKDQIFEGVPLLVEPSQDKPNFYNPPKAGGSKHVGYGKRNSKRGERKWSKGGGGRQKRRKR